jgi:hypothetical protein|nr:MAG: hypothetical protein [Bacteriophage sp.]
MLEDALQSQNSAVRAEQRLTKKTLSFFKSIKVWFPNKKRLF